MGHLVAPSQREEIEAIEDLLGRSRSHRIAAAVVARNLITEFGSFAAVLAGSTSRLRRAGADDDAIQSLRWCRRAVLLSLRRQVVSQPLIGTSSALLDYLHVDMSTGTRERFRTLHLNARNELLLDDEPTHGTIDAAPFYAREIVGRAIEVGATSLILVHNHPSGDPRPSSRDIDATRSLAIICAGLSITLLDHLIVGRDSILSLRSAGLLGQ